MKIKYVFLCGMCGICLLLSACGAIVTPPTDAADKPPAPTVTISSDNPTDQPSRPTRQPRQPTLTPRSAAPRPTLTPTTQAGNQPGASGNGILTVLNLDYNLQGEAVWDAFISADGAHLIVFVDDDQLDVYDLVSGQAWNVTAPIEFFYAPNVFVTATEVIILDYYAHDNMPVVIWRVDLASGEPRQTASVTSGELYPIQAALSPDGSMAAVGYNNGVISLYRTSDGGLIRSIQAHIDTVTSLAFSPGGNYLISDPWSFDPHTYVFNVSTGGLAAALSAESWEPGVVDFSPDGSLASYIQADGTYLVTTNDWMPTGVFIPGVWEGVFTCDSSGFMAATGDGFEIYSLTTGEITRVLDVYPLYCLSDGRMVTVDYQDNVVTLSLVDL